MQDIKGELTKAYSIISNFSDKKFDYNKAAELELEWWMVDRYPDRYNTSREEAINLPIALVYGADLLKLGEYASNRAKAMVLQDKAELESKEANWSNIESLLQLSYRSLSAAIK